MNIVTATKSNNTLTVLVNENGNINPIPVTSEHPKWADIIKAWADQNFEALIELLSMKRIVEKFSNGDLVVTDNGVFYKDIPLTGIDVDRIMAFLRTGDPYFPIANYMARKLKNPSKRAIGEMYNFLEHKNMPLTPSGTILAYKGVKKDFFSVSCGKEPLLSGRRNEEGRVFNGVGETIEMSRSDVDDDFRVGCSGGLHAGSLQYARDWARQHDGIIILIEIDPPDVVSVPEDCNCTKLRCCKYKVIGLYTGPLPDTYTNEFSDPLEDSECNVCGCRPASCTCEEIEVCNQCGNTESYCSCENEDECCGHCGDQLDFCDCGESQTDEPATPNVVNESDEEIPQPVVENITDEKGDEIRQKFVAMVCELLGGHPEDVTDNKRFIEDLGADSLDTIELAIGAEETFNIEIPDELAQECNTVGKAITEVRRLLGLCPCSLNENCTCPEPPNLPPVLSTFDPNLDSFKRGQNLDSFKSDTRNKEPFDSYQEGYQVGFRNGVRRRKRLYYQKDCDGGDYVPDNNFARGYCEGYRAGRKDYKH